MHWSPDDTHVVSAGMDGAVYEWRLKDFKREKENVLKGCNYTSVLATPDCKTLYAAGACVRACVYLCACACAPSMHPTCSALTAAFARWV